MADELDLTGAADLHCHFVRRAGAIAAGPDPAVEGVPALVTAREAAEHGYAAVVLKSHVESTVSMARVIDDVVPGVRVFGGMPCDLTVGGVNPWAVEAALQGGAKIIWLPTLSSVVDAERGVPFRLGRPSDPGLRVTDDSGSLLRETLDIMDLVREHDAILGTGHVSATEHFAVASARPPDLKLLVTHAMETMGGPMLTVQQCVELAALGAFIELSSVTCTGSYAGTPVAQVAECVRAVGADRATLCTDLGAGPDIFPHPTVGLRRFAEALVAEGIPAPDVRQMACDNPCGLLGL
jgi:hypothetical protein